MVGDPHLVCFIILHFVTVHIISPYNFQDKGKTGIPLKVRSAYPLLFRQRSGPRCPLKTKTQNHAQRLGGSQALIGLSSRKQIHPEYDEAIPACGDRKGSKISCLLRDIPFSPLRHRRNECNYYLNPVSSCQVVSVHRVLPLPGMQWRLCRFFQTLQQTSRRARY